MQLKRETSNDYCSPDQPFFFHGHRAETRDNSDVCADACNSRMFMTLTLQATLVHHREALRVIVIAILNEHLWTTWNTVAFFNVDQEALLLRCCSGDRLEVYMRKSDLLNRLSSLVFQAPPNKKEISEASESHSFGEEKEEAGLGCFCFPIYCGWICLFLFSHFMIAVKELGDTWMFFLLQRLFFALAIQLWSSTGWEHLRPKRTNTFERPKLEEETVKEASQSERTKTLCGSGVIWLNIISQTLHLRVLCLKTFMVGFFPTHRLPDQISLKSLGALNYTIIVVCVRTFAAYWSWTTWTTWTTFSTKYFEHNFRWTTLNRYGEFCYWSSFCSWQEVVVKVSKLPSEVEEAEAEEMTQVEMWTEKSAGVLMLLLLFFTIE